MRPRTVKLCVSLMGMAKMPVATITVQKFADIRKPQTELRCPNCGEKPEYQPAQYKCKCGFVARSWMKLKRVVQATGEVIEKVRLLQPKEEVTADLYVMPIEEFSQYVDATRAEYGVVVKDETSAKNLKKLIIATEKLGKVIVIRYKDTYEEVVGILTLSLSGRVIIKDIIPLNLLDVKETLRVNVAEVTPEELAEAEKFVSMLPPANEEHFKVKDYRLIGLEEKPVSEKVLELEKIIAKAKQVTA